MKRQGNEVGIVNALTCAGVQARVTEELGWRSSCHQLNSCTLLTPIPLNQAAKPRGTYLCGQGVCCHAGGTFSQVSWCMAVLTCVTWLLVDAMVKL